MKYKKFFQMILWVCPVIGLYWFCNSLDYRLETGWKFSNQILDTEFLIFQLGTSILIIAPFVSTITIPYTRLVDKETSVLVLLLGVALLASIVGRTISFLCSAEKNSLIGIGNRIWEISMLSIPILFIIFAPYILTKLLGGLFLEFGNTKGLEDEDLEEITLHNSTIQYADPGL